MQNKCEFTWEAGQLNIDLYLWEFTHVGQSCGYWLRAKHSSEQAMVSWSVPLKILVAAWAADNARDYMQASI